MASTTILPIGTIPPSHRERRLTFVLRNCPPFFGGAGWHWYNSRKIDQTSLTSLGRFRKTLPLHDDRGETTGCHWTQFLTVVSPSWSVARVGR